jgi:hypothetical protein
MPAIDDLEVIRELLTGKPPSQDVNDYVKSRLTAVIAAAEPGPDTGRPVRRDSRSHRTAAEAARRRRRLAWRSAAGVATLAAAAVAVVAVVAPVARRDDVDTTAYAVKRVSHALSAAEPGEIAQMTVTTRGAAIYGGKSTTTTAEEWSNGDQWRLVTYSPDGRPLYDEGFGSSSLYTLVNYQARTWARQHGLGPGARGVSVLPGQPGCQPTPAAASPLLFAYGLPGTGSSASSLPSTVARELRAAVSCGSLTSAGRQRVDGIETIELTSGPSSPVSETVWVSQSTYLPVRAVVRLSFGKLPGREQTADFTWLPPTAQNLAKLTVPIPAGFRQVAVSSAVLPILQQLPALPAMPGAWPNKVTCLGPDGPTCKNQPGGYK